MSAHIVKVSNNFGIVVKKSAITREGIVHQDLLALMECASPFDENNMLISFGPHFGGEAANEFIRRLEQAGLQYVDDFMDFQILLPEWCETSICIRESSIDSNAP